MTTTRRKRSHCLQGHEYTAENTRTLVNDTGRPQRICVECQRQKWREYAQRQRAKATDMERIDAIIGRVMPDIAARAARYTNHTLKCPYWDRIDPRACSCETRPLIDLLLHIAERTTT